MAQAAQCMPSNTTLDRQQPDSVFSGKLNAAHSVGSSSSCMRSSFWSFCEDKGKGGQSLTEVMF
jgi:hypothetical protein